MYWLILSLLTAVAASSQDAWVKKFFSRFSPYEMSMYPLVYSCPLFVIAIFWVSVPPLDATFFWCFFLSLPINGISLILYMKAIKTSPLSLTLPYLAFTPAFMIFTGYLFLGEVLNIWGVLGILITCLDSSDYISVKSAGLAVRGSRGLNFSLSFALGKASSGLIHPFFNKAMIASSRSCIPYLRLT